MQVDDDLNVGELQERRQFRRVKQTLSGRVYFPATAEEAVCTIEGISAGGALVCCALSRPAAGQVILYAGNLGRIEGQVESAADNAFTMSFSCSRKRRDRLADQLTVELNRQLLNGHDHCVNRAPQGSDSDG